MPLPHLHLLAALHIPYAHPRIAATASDEPVRSRVRRHGRRFIRQHMRDCGRSKRGRCRRRREEMNGLAGRDTQDALARACGGAINDSGCGRGAKFAGADGGVGSKGADRDLGAQIPPADVAVVGG